MSLDHTLKGDPAEWTTHYERAPVNLKALLAERYKFVRENVRSGNLVLEIGAGNGWLRYILDDVSMIQVDCVGPPWIHVVADGGNLPFAAESFDAVVCIAVLHHINFPVAALHEISRVLKPSGKVLIVEPHVSLLLRLALSLTFHEYIDQRIDPYSGQPCLTRPGDNWSGNNAIGDCLFREPEVFDRAFPELKIVSHRFTEAILLLNSGGVYKKVPYIPLPVWLLNLCCVIDKFLCRLAPDMFAICQEMVLIKRGPSKEA
jgi:SAM-dependent methyltransferase